MFNFRAAFAVAMFMVFVSAQAAEGPQFTPDGALLRPEDYREWVFLSSGLGMNYGPNAAGSRPEHPPFDNVFVSRPAYKAFRETGRWPDKTMFVLELRSSESKGSINTGGHFQTDVRAIEVELKDEKRYGGKWMFFDFGKSAASVKPLPTTERCYSCHAEHGAVDNTFVQFYPTLISVAKDKGTFKGQ